MLCATPGLERVLLRPCPDVLSGKRSHSAHILQSQVSNQEKKRISIFVHFFFYILPLFPHLHTLNNSDFRLLDFWSFLWSFFSV